MTVRRATYTCWAIALAAGILYALAAARAGLGGVAVGGGLAWVVLLTLIITLPVVIPLARRALPGGGPEAGSGGGGDGGWQGGGAGRAGARAGEGGDGRHRHGG